MFLMKRGDTAILNAVSPRLIYSVPEESDIIFHWKVGLLQAAYRLDRLQPDSPVRIPR